jgi:Hydrazine synthase alpha subunit middle domain
VKQLALCLLLTMPVFAQDIAYTSAPRDMTKPATYWEDSSALQQFTDVSALTMGFQESDLYIRKADGTDVLVYGCTMSPDTCAAQEAMPSPDGKRLAFSVTTGTLYYGTMIAPIKSKILIYDIASKTLTEVPNQPADGIARTPDWISDTTLVFAANWGNTYPVRDQFNCHQGVYPPDHQWAGALRAYNNGACASVTYTDASMKSLQIWRMNIDGSGKKNLTPAETQAVRPRVLHHPRNKGRIVFSSFQNQEDRCWYQGSAGMGTCLNRWWLMTMANDGTSTVVFAGSHHSPTLSKGGYGDDQFVAMRPVGEAPNGELCVSNYYRGNHMGGLGPIWCAALSVGDFQVEGCATQGCLTGNVTYPNFDPNALAQFIPQNMHYIYPVGQGLDNNQTIDSSGRTTGVMGYPFALANGHMMTTWGRGWCYNQQGSGSAFDGTSASIGGEPMCDMNIVEMLVPIVTDPHDPAQLKVLIGDTTKHEFDAVEIRPRPITHVQPPLDETKGCYLEVVDLRNTDIAPLGPYRWNMRAEDVGVQGNAVKPQDKAFHKDNVKGLAIYGIQNHTTYYPDPKWQAAVNYTGYEKVWKIGEQKMMADGSLKMRVPCEQPFFMSAVNSYGRWMMHDPWLHSLQKGETKTCFGCHDGHSIERRLDLGGEPQALFARTQASTTNPALPVTPPNVTFADIAPVITRACSGCHEGFQNDDLLWSRVFADQEQLDYPWMTQMFNHNGQATVPRPYWTGLTGRYARQSMLIWVMEGKRIDGRKNEDATDDQDYPTGHPRVPVSSDGKTRVVEYIQLGAPMP